MAEVGRPSFSRLLAAVALGCATLALVALLAPQERASPRNRLQGWLRLRQGAGELEKAMGAQDVGDAGEFDWCVSKAKKGACSTPAVAHWCAQVCQAHDMDGDCLQSILDIKCARLLPDSAARLSEGRWGCFQGLYKQRAAACVTDAAQPALCYEPDNSVSWVEADEPLRALIADNGCDDNEPAGWIDAHPHAPGSCVDMLPWSSLPDGRSAHSGRAYECADYARLGWCALETVVDPARGGRANNRPEEHCCACGGGDRAAPAIPEAEACAESQMAVHLALAAHFNGTALRAHLPDHFALAGEYHTHAAADALLGTNGGVCWAAFRGSEDDGEWVTDAISALGAPCAAANGESMGECGLGFYYAHQSLREAGLIRALAELSSQGKCPNGIRLTGHSLGAGLASIAAADLFTLSQDKNRSRALRLGQPLTPASLRVYTFGEPRSLRWYAADWFNAHVAKVRWLNWGDPLPASPPTKWGFKHW